VLERALVEEFGTAAEADPELILELDLPGQRLSSSGGFTAEFAIDPGAKRMLVEGLDGVGLTLTRRHEIELFREEDRAARPWVYELGQSGSASVDNGSG